MKPFSSAWLGTLVQSGILVSVLAANALGCGMDWGIVRNHFEGVFDERGTVDLWDSLGDLHVGNGEKLPLYYNFGSGMNNASPYLGQGWYLPLLESTAVQQDENTFKVTMPNGKYYWFWRDKKNPNILNGQQNWKAEIRGDSIVAVAECGGKATFVKGKLISFSTKGGTVLDFIQENGRTSELRSSSAGSVLKVKTDLKTGTLNGISFGGQTVKLEFGERPVVQSIQKQNMVTRMAATLNKVTLPDGATKTYDFAVNDQVQPTLKTHGHQYVWDPASGRILTDGEWTYSMTDLNTAGIGRKNAKGEIESWFYDGAKGMETIVMLDGAKTVKTWFTSGKLAGKTRELRSNTKNNVPETIYKASYDQDGRLLREYDKRINTFYNASYNSQGRLETESYDKRVTSYSYYEKSFATTTTMPSGRVIVRLFDTEKKLLSISIE